MEEHTDLITREEKEKHICMQRKTETERNTRRTKEGKTGSEQEKIIFEEHGYFSIGQILTKITQWKEKSNKKLVLIPQKVLGLFPVYRSAWHGNTRIMHLFLFLTFYIGTIERQVIKVDAFPSFANLFSLGGKEPKNEATVKEGTSVSGKSEQSIALLMKRVNAPKASKHSCQTDTTPYEDWLNRYDYTYSYNYSLYDSPLSSLDASHSFSVMANKTSAVESILTEAHNKSLEWGAYRPGHYFEVKSRTEPYFFLTGLGWHGGRSRISDMRYECRQEDGIRRYGWVEHDGRYYGKQEILDPKQNAKLTIYFVKPEYLSVSTPSSSSSLSSACLAPEVDQERGKQEEEEHGTNIKKKTEGKSINSFSKLSEQFKWVSRIKVEAIDEKSPAPVVYIYGGLDCDGYLGEKGDSYLKSKLIPSSGISINHSKKHDSDSDSESDSVLTLTSKVAEQMLISGENERYGKFRLHINTIIEDNTSNQEAFSTKSWLGYVDDMSNMKNNIIREMQDTPTSSTLNSQETEQMEERNKNAAIFRISSGSIKYTIDLGFQSHIDEYEDYQEGEEKFDDKDENSDVSEEGEYLEKERARGEAIQALSTSAKLTGTMLTKFLQLYAIPIARDNFSKRFKETYGLEEKGYYDKSNNIIRFNEAEIKVGKAALSNMIGSMGYFSGQTPIKSDKSSEMFLSFHTSLFTAVPSRSFFPRGFLWDEGFHQLLIVNWDERITYDAILHWFSNQHGNKKCPEAGAWIPREIAIGTSAQKRIPFEYLAQDPTVANPPSLLLVLEKILKKAKQERDTQVNENNESDDNTEKDRKRHSEGHGKTYDQEGISHLVQPEEREKFLKYMYPRVRAWMTWFLQSQQGSIPGSFRWRGRDPNESKLHPNTLASGLDDYPRATQPDDIEERHVDLLCWIIKACQVTSELAVFAGDNENNLFYNTLANDLIKSLHRLHWHEALGAHFDYGIHSNNAEIVETLELVCANAQTRQRILYQVPTSLLTPEIDPNTICPAAYSKFQGVKSRTPSLHLVPGKDFGPSLVEQFGYVALFPFLFQLLDENNADSDCNSADNEEEKKQSVSICKTGQLLKWIKDPNIGLWSNYGLRSLSNSDKYYLIENAPGDAPYWRGYIWININYLAIRALHLCANDTTSKYTEECWSLYKELRNNVLKTILTNYERTGYLWEQYDDRTGEGRRCHPFTGWSALVLNIMGEVY